MANRKQFVKEPFETDDPFKEGMWRLTKVYVQDFLDNPDATQESIAHSPVYIGVLMTTYQVFTNSGELTKLEDISDEHKTRLWSDAVRLIPVETFPPSDNRGKLVQRRRLNFCKAMWLINSVVEKLELVPE